MSPEEVIDQYSESGLKIKITDLDKEMVLIEGDKEALLFLSKLIGAHAVAHDCGFHMSPFGAGCAWFADGSTKGIYIHRIPCDETVDQINGGQCPGPTSPG